MLEHGRFIQDEPEFGDSSTLIDINGETECWDAFDLARAKLLFKSGENGMAMELVESVISAYNKRNIEGTLQPRSRERVADAYYLAGWIAIHKDDHTAAYAWWSRGHACLGNDENLARQSAKRSLWDDDTFNVDAHARQLESVFGSTECAQGDFRFNRQNHFDAFAVSGDNVARCAALGLFDPHHQRNELVFRTKIPLLTRQECSNVCKIAEEHVRKHLGGEWGTVRSSSVKTTDIAVEDIPALRPWLKALMKRCLYPMLAETFPVLADGTTIIDANGKSRMRLHDAFIVRYDTSFGSLNLPEHFDTSSMSFTVTLNDTFKGGGTWFETLGDDAQNGLVVDGECGHAVAFAGPVRHAGYPITEGVRMILVMFCYVEDFAYGQYLKRYCGAVNKRANGAETRPSGDTEGGYVVYRQTVELASMLAKSDV